MDALSGLDPKYIDEAAFELHGKPVRKKNANKSGVIRGIFIALPVAAAVLITVMVALPALFRMSSSSSSSMSETGSYAPASEEAASDASASYDAAEAPSEPTWDYEAAEEPSWDYDAVESESETAAVADTASEEAANASASTKDEATTEIVGSSEPSATETAGSEISAEYDNGILTIENITLPEDIDNTEYTIAKTTATGTEITYSEGNLGDIITETEPLTLDISELMLPEGTYTITIGDEIAEFTVLH